jgi:hypothetical protein
MIPSTTTMPAQTAAFAALMMMMTMTMLTFAKTALAQTGVEQECYQGLFVSNSYLTDSFNVPPGQGAFRLPNVSSFLCTCTD